MQFTNFPEIQDINYYIEKYDCGIESFDFNCRENTLSDEVLIEKLKTKYKQINSIHGPYKGLDYSSEDKRIVEKTYEAYSRFHDIALALTCKRIIVHNMCCMEDNESGYQRSVLFWKRYLAEHKGVQYCLENIIDKSPALLIRLHDEIDSDALKICLDVGHVNVEAGNEVVDWIRLLGSRIAHVHLHNNDGSADAHNALGDGTIDMLATLRMLQTVLPKEYWNLETSQLEASFLWLEENGFIP